MINDTVHQVIVPGGLSNCANHKKHFSSSHVISICDAGDRPLVVQFAASNARDFADAAELVAPYADGVDLNCGCPQRYEGEPSVEVVHTSLVLRCQKEIPASPVSRSLPYIHTGWGPGNEAGSQHILQISVPSPLTHTHTGGQWLRVMVPI